MKKKGIGGLLLLGVICFAACHKTVVTPTVSQQFTADSTAIVTYLADNHINATFHDSIWYVLNETGQGPKPTRFDCVTITYSVYELGVATPFQANTDGLKGPLKGLIDGMQIGLKKFPLGSKGLIYIPSLLAYGANGTTDSSGNPVVHPNTPIVFDLALVDMSPYNVAANYCYE
jgi:FKBP-type peptidyl-prolyl cis-trans isomerase